MKTWPTDNDVDRALAALNEARLGVRGPISRQAMRKALIAGLHRPDTRTQAEKDYEFELYLGMA
jgi:hypothetical protein